MFSTKRTYLLDTRSVNADSKIYLADDGFFDICSVNPSKSFHLLSLMTSSEMGSMGDGYRSLGFRRRENSRDPVFLRTLETLSET